MQLEKVIEKKSITKETRFRRIKGCMILLFVSNGNETLDWTETYTPRSSVLHTRALTLPVMFATGKI